VSSGTDLCEELIILPEEFYQLCVRRCLSYIHFKNDEAVFRIGSQRHEEDKTPVELVLEKMKCVICNSSIVHVLLSQ